jgi:CHASE1-domain containing sensor protein
LLLAALVFVAVSVLIVVLIVRMRAALSSLEEELDRIERLQSAGETVLEMTGESARAAVSEQLSISLPESATNVFFARQGTVRPAYWLRFSLDRQHVQPFLNQTCLATVTEGETPPFRYAVEPDILVNLTWWRPDTALDPAGGQCDWRPDVDFRLVLDRAQREQTIFIEISGPTADQDD